MQGELNHTQNLDFLYVDYERICSFLQQIKGVGALRKSEEGFNTSDSESNIISGKLPPFVDASTKGVYHASQSKIMGYETYWHNALEFLGKCGAVDKTTAHALNQLRLLNGTLSLITLDLIQNSVQIAEGGKNSSTDLDVIQLLFKGLFGNFYDGNYHYWFTLNESGLKQEPSVLALKYGVNLGSGWSCICIVDTLADTAGDECNSDGAIVLGSTSINDQLVHLYERYKAMLGQPSGFIGITPILIYREVDSTQSCGGKT